jgi:hypothetical protein
MSYTSARAAGGTSLPRTGPGTVFQSRRQFIGFSIFGPARCSRARVTKFTKMSAAGWEIKTLDEQLLDSVRSGLKTVKVIFYDPLRISFNLNF